LWRWLAITAAVLMPALVAWSRMYRGEHHPLDVAGGILLALLWLAAVALALRPNADLDEGGPATARASSPAPATVPPATTPPAPANSPTATWPSRSCHRGPATCWPLTWACPRARPTLSPLPPHAAAAGWTSAWSGTGVSR